MFASRRKRQWASGVIEEADVMLVLDADGKERRLGSGASGEVLQGVYQGIQPVAIKVLNNITADQKGKLSKEVVVLRACRHPHIVSFQGVALMNDKVWLVMELMSGGDLSHALQLGDTYRWFNRGPQVAYDIASALAYLHHNRVIHMDVKSANVLLTHDGRAKLGDVGLATWLTAHQTHASLPGMSGTFSYVAPEVLGFNQAACSADIFSFGVVLWEIVTGEVSRRGCMREPRVPEECQQDVADLIDRCCTMMPEARPTATDLMSFLAKHLGNSLQQELTPDLSSSADTHAD
eukprot:jgi/Botrbrau1/3152/Bobra.0070s0118.1